MLRILDTRTGESVTAAPARRGLTRVDARAPGLDLTAVRVLLTADLLVRALELGGTPVWAMLTAPERHAELRTAATALGIRPFEDGRDLAAGLGEAQVIHVMPQDAPGAPGPGPVLTVAPAAGIPKTPGAAEVPQEVPTAPAGSPAPRAGLPAGLLADPPALRLALLSVPRDTPARVDGARLAEAARTLGRWRHAVAGWARQPSRPVPEDVRTRLRTAWEDDLDLPGVLGVLRAMAEDPALPAGARFETYVYADRLLALDLAREVGTLG